MVIKAIIKMTDGNIIERLFGNYADLDAWVERHRGHFRRISTQQIVPGEIRQGRE